MKLLRRYTDLPALLYLLKNKCITLLDPKSWDDKNDSHFIDEYKRYKKFKTVLALCFTQSAERYHHWKVFAGTCSGVCIYFDKNKLLELFPTGDKIIFGNITYKEIKNIRTAQPNSDELPFLKRYPFKDEREFRIIYRDSNSDIPCKDFGIELSCISRIVLSPWMAKPISESVKMVIKDIDGCSGLQINKTWERRRKYWMATKVKLFPK